MNSWQLAGSTACLCLHCSLVQPLLTTLPLPALAPLQAEPSCDFRLAADGKAVELVAVRGIAAGEEATISYTGKEG